MSKKKLNTNFRSNMTNVTEIGANVPRVGFFSPILYNINTSDKPITLNTLGADYTHDKVIISSNAFPTIASTNLQIHF